MKALVVVTRQIGDVLLTTPLIRSLARAYPGIVIDVLVTRGTEGALAGNADIRDIITIPERPTIRENVAVLKRIIRRYDLSLTVLPGDRPTGYALAASANNIGLVPMPGQTGHWKKWLLRRAVPFEPNTMTVAQSLRLADALGIGRYTCVVPPSCADTERHTLAGLLSFPLIGSRFVVIHPAPLRRYKQWTRNGWREVASYLHQNDLKVVLTGGPAASERRYTEDLFGDLPFVENLVGRLSLGQVTALIEASCLYIGPDTATTHLAAATGTPTVALYGPTGPTVWGPWPHCYSEPAPPYINYAANQRAGNVFLIQGIKDCVPCQREGCENHRESFSLCLDELPFSRVRNAIESLLKDAPPSHTTK